MVEVAHLVMENQSMNAHFTITMLFLGITMWIAGFSAMANVIMEQFVDISVEGKLTHLDGLKALMTEQI